MEKRNLEELGEKSQEIGVREANATRAIFFVSGFGAASWAPLVPVLRERLAIGDDLLGILLLCIGIGSLLAMPLAGVLADACSSWRLSSMRRRCSPSAWWIPFGLQCR